jgi:hypothetical protein
MEKSPFSLVVGPMNHRRRYNEDTSYTLRTPHINLQNAPEEFIDTVEATARVAFHGKKGTIKFLTDKPHIPNLIERAERLGDLGCLQFDSIDERELVNERTINEVSIACVDKREDDEGADPFRHTAQITHAGSLVMLDPRLHEIVPPQLLNYLTNDVIKVLKETGARISRISAHFGLDEVKGCGGVDFLRQSSELAKKILNSPKGIKDALDRVRNEYHEVMAPNCVLIGDVIYPDGGLMAFNMDSPPDLANMMETGPLNI